MIVDVIPTVHCSYYEVSRFLVSELESAPPEDNFVG